MKLSSARDSYPPGWRIQRRSISSGTGLPWLVHWLSSKQFSSNQLYQAGQGQVTSREVARITFHTNQYFVFWPGTSIRYSCKISTICSSICPAQGTQSSCRVVFRNQIISGDKSLFSVSRVILLLIYRREEGTGDAISGRCQVHITPSLPGSDTWHYRVRTIFSANISILPAL